MKAMVDSSGFGIPPKEKIQHLMAIHEFYWLVSIKDNEAKLGENGWTSPLRANHLQH